MMVMAATPARNLPFMMGSRKMGWEASLDMVPVLFSRLMECCGIIPNSFSEKYEGIYPRPPHVRRGETVVARGSGSTREYR